MTQIDQIIADALAGLPETDVAILAREVVRLREAPAVVVPELTEDRLSELFGAPVMINHNPSVEQIGYTNRRNAFRDGWNSCKKAFQPIPAGRVLGEGMVAVDARDLDSVISEIDECSKWPHLCENSDIHRHSPAGKRIRALRANQGGADHD